jgi:hypothetical protein
MGALIELVFILWFSVFCPTECALVQCPNSLVGHDAVCLSCFEKGEHEAANFYTEMEIAFDSKREAFGLMQAAQMEADKWRKRYWSLVYRNRKRRKGKLAYDSR